MAKHSPKKFAIYIYFFTSLKNEKYEEAEYIFSF